MATPNNMPATNPLAGMNVSDTARGLYVDPTPAFQPALEQIGKQRVQANERYAQNKADIANIFGTLTQVNTESQNRVNQQFQESVANQQMATAQRVAEARSGAAQTQQAAIKAADERGGGPMGNLAASPVAVEAERGIANQNALQTLFAGQQGAIQQQTIQDLLAAQRGYGYQQLAANQQLGRSLEDVLMGLSGQETDIRGQLAQAQLGARGQVAQANYNEIMQARQAAADAANARTSAAARVRAAQISAANRLEVERLKQAGRTPDIGTGALGAAQLLQAEGRTGSQVNSFLRSLDSVDISNARNSAEAYDAWLKVALPKGGKATQRAGITGAERLAARMYFDSLRYTGPAENTLMPNWSTTPTNPTR